jgi:hypothetical protein
MKLRFKENKKPFQKGKMAFGKGKLSKLLFGK